MTSNQTDKLDAENLNRRRLLQGIAATGAVTTAAGCLGDDDDTDDGADGTDDADDGDDDGPVGLDDDDDDDEPTDLEMIQEGGRLEFAVERGGLDNYDQAESSLADDSTVFNVVYENLFTQNPEGEVINWLADDYEVTDARDVSFPEDYTDYMGEYEIANDEGDLPAVDLDWPNMIHPGGWHPDDLAAYQEGELGAGDTIRALSREDAQDAAEDDVYGTKVSGTLHEGITFSNGEECTAGNVVGSYDRFVGSNNEGQVYGDFLAALAPDGDDSLEFELYAKEADAVALVDVVPFDIYPSEHIGIEPGGLNPLDGGEVPIGTGPYEISEFEEGSQLLLEKRDDYWVEEVGLDTFDWWDGEDEFPAGPVVDEINIRFVPEDGTRVASLQDGEIDIAYQLPAGDRTAFDADDNFTVVAAVSTGFLFMTFPITEPGAFENREVREAVNQLIPRRDIIEIVAEGWGTPAEAPLPEPASGLGTNLSYEEFKEQDYAYPADPNVERAEELIDESPLDPPIEMIVRTNADDEERQDKMQILVDELNASGLFEASLETPGDISDWFLDLIQPDSTEVYAEDNALAVIGLASGFDPDGYHRFINLSEGYNACCNWFHPPGTFDWEDDYNETRFGTDVAADPDLRRDRFDDLWPRITEDLGTTIIDYSLETAVAGPRVQGYEGYPDRRGFLSYGLWAPYDDVVAYLDQEE